MDALPVNVELKPATRRVMAAERPEELLPDAVARESAEPWNRAVQKLGVPLVFLLLALVAYNVVIERTAASSQRRQLLARIENIPAETDCLFLGNSLVEAGCNTKSFETAWPKGKAPPKAMNVALGATSTVEHYLILKRALQNRTHLTYVIYGFFDDQLNTAPNGAWSDLVGNRAFSYYFPDEAAEMYAPGSWFKKWQLRLTARVPMLAERSSLWGKVDLLRRSLEEVGMPRRKTNRFGRVEDFGALEAADAASFDRRCRTAAQGFSRPVEELLRLAHQRDATVILLEMPMPSHHRRLFYSSPAWQELRARLNSLAKQEGALYLSASDWIQDDRNFEDATHLNEQGASQFSSQLAGAVAWVSLDRPLAGTQGDAH